MLPGYTDDQITEQPVIDGAVLESRGWVLFALRASAESGLREQLFALASGLGAPCPIGKSA